MSGRPGEASCTSRRLISSRTSGAAGPRQRKAGALVSLDEAKVPQLTPVRGQPSDVMVNAGQYRSSYLLGGLRFSTRF
jgi:hypothetical protein